MCLGTSAAHGCSTVQYHVCSCGLSHCGTVPTTRYPCVPTTSTLDSCLLQTLLTSIHLGCWGKVRHCQGPFGSRGPLMPGRRGNHALSLLLAEALKGHTGGRRCVQLDGLVARGGIWPLQPWHAKPGEASPVQDWYWRGRQRWGCCAMHSAGGQTVPEFPLPCPSLYADYAMARNGLLQGITAYCLQGTTSGSPVETQRQERTHR